MYTTTKLRYLLPAFIMLTLTACKKDGVSNTEDEETVITIAATEEDAGADLIFSDVFDQSVGVSADFGLGVSDLFGQPESDNGSGIESNDPLDQKCFTITVKPLEPNVFPKTVTIDFGDGCLGRDGKTRKGKMIAVYSNRIIVPGSQVVTEFDGYYVNGVKVEGRHVVRNKSTSDALIFTRIVQNGKLTFPNGTYVSWNAEHTNTQTAGLGTPFYHKDDEFSITGGARGETKRGDVLVNWSRRIEEALHKSAVCRWFDKGIVVITRNDKKAVLNYGNGTCDNKATITAGGQTKEITLR